MTVNIDYPVVILTGIEMLQIHRVNVLQATTKNYIMYIMIGLIITTRIFINTQKLMELHIPPAYFFLKVKH